MTPEQAAAELAYRRADARAAAIAENCPTQNLDTDETLTGRTDIRWDYSRTTATTEHHRDNPTAMPEVIHTLYLRVTPMALPKVQLRYGIIKFWPEKVIVVWNNGSLRAITVEGHQATKAGLGKDVRERTFDGNWNHAAKAYDPLSMDKVPAALREVIARYEGRVPVANPSPMVIE